jgi:hypothetical protein
MSLVHIQHPRLSLNSPRMDTILPGSLLTHLPGVLAENVEPRIINQRERINFAVPSALRHDTARLKEGNSFV